MQNHRYLRSRRSVPTSAIGSPNNAVEQTAGSHSLAAADQRGRSTHNTVELGDALEAPAGEGGGEVRKSA